MRGFELVAFQSPFHVPGEIMKPCKSCRLALNDGVVSQSFPNIEKLLRFHGFAQKMIHDVAVSLGPMCEKCLKDWAKELRSL
jgi:hypothetical protein